MEEFFDRDALFRGDEKAWRGFYQSYSPLIRRILSWPKWRFSGEDQEDMLQEVMVGLMRSVKEFKGDAKLSTFVARVAQNHCVSAIRKKLTRKRGDGQGAASLDELAEFSPSGDPAVIDSVIERDRRARVNAALGKLGPGCVELIKLRYLEEWTFREISEKSGEPIGTIATWLKKCLQHFRSLCLAAGLRENGEENATNSQEDVS